MNKVTIFEFIGLPGCGKTTLAKLAQDSLNASGCKCLDFHSIGLRKFDGFPGLLRTAFQASFFFIRQPLLLIEMARFAAALLSTDRLVPKIALLILKQTYALDCAVRAAETEGCDCIIFDQATLQTIWSILLHSSKLPVSRTQRMISALRRYIAPFVICCQLDTRTSYHRMTNRKVGWSRLTGMNETDAVSLLDKRLPYFSAISQIAQKTTGCTVLTVDTSEDMLDVRDQIVRFIIEMIHKETPEESQHV